MRALASCGVFLLPWHMSTSPDTGIGPLVSRLETLFEERLGLRRGGFETRAARASRMMPRWVGRDLAQVVEARRIADNPKLARMIDVPALHAATERVAAHLRTVDPAERRAKRRLGMLAALMVNLLLLFALVVAVLAWRGFL